MGNQAGGMGIITRPQFVDFRIDGGNVLFYWRMHWESFEYDEDDVKNAVIFGTRLTSGGGYTASQTMGTSPSDNPIIGQEFGTGSAITIANYWQFQSKSGSAGKALLNLLEASRIEAGDPVKVGVVKLESFQDAGMTISVNAGNLASVDNNPSYFDVIFEAPDPSLTRDARLTLCYTGQTGSKFIQANIDGSNGGTTLLRPFKDFILKDVPFDDLGLCCSSSTVTDPEELGGCAMLQYKAHDGTLKFDGDEYQNYHACFAIEEVAEPGKNLGASAYSYDSSRLLQTGRCGTAGDPSCPKINGQVQCCSGEGMGDCVPENSAWFQDQAMKFVIAIGFDPRSLQGGTFLCSSVDKNNKQRMGKYVWKRYTAHGMRKGQRVHGVANTVFEENAQEEVTVWDTKIDGSILQIESFLTVTQNTIYEAQEIWRQMFTVFDPDSEYREILEAEAGNRSFGAVVPQDGELRKLALEKLTTIAQSMGFAIQGDNFVYGMTLSATNTDGPTTSQQTMTVEARVSYDNILKDIVDPNGSTLKKDVVSVDVKYSVDGALKRHAYVDQNGNRKIEDHDPNSAYEAQVISVGVSHKMYFMNDWYFEYNVGSSSTTTTTINGVGDTGQPG